MRGASLKIKNKNGQIPADCIVIKNPKCKTVVQLSTMLHGLMSGADSRRNPQHTKRPLVGGAYDSTGSGGVSVFEHVVTNDITRGKETYPVQCVNGLDDAGVPTNYVYVRQNCVTTNVPIDRNISTLQVCCHS